jgi:hypothetical protein
MVVANITYRNDGIPARLAALETRATNVEARATDLEALLWEDLRFPASAVNLAGAAVPPDTDVTNFVGALVFLGNKDSDIGFMVQMPHGWANGTSIYPHMHIVNTSGATTATDWELKVRKADVGEDFGAYATDEKSFSPTTGASLHQLWSFTPIDLTGLGDSCMLAFWLRRKGASDTNNGSITLLEFDIHYQSATRGSVTEAGDR